MDITTLNEIISNIKGCDCEEFSNFFDELQESNQEFDQDHFEEILEFLNDRLNIISEEELSDLTSFEKRSLSDFIDNLL
ncbi:MAG: hypothetical protein JXR88_15005 [Clostridia bacterium]|nr:hypothetical protein [Clostridia bacterium]